jgi:hypothetical protein
MSQDSQQAGVIAECRVKNDFNLNGDVEHCPGSFVTLKRRNDQKSNRISSTYSYTPKPPGAGEVT